MTALQQLSALAAEAKRQQHPNVPPHALPPPRRYEDQTANGLTWCIIDYVRLCGGQAERISSEGRVIDDRKTFQDVVGRVKSIGGIKRVYSSTQRGTADISATIKGRSVKVEVKVGKDRQSPKQKEYQQQVERAGGLYFIAKDFQRFFDWYTLTFESHE